MYARKKKLIILHAFVLCTDQGFSSNAVFNAKILMTVMMMMTLMKITIIV